MKNFSILIIVTALLAVAATSPVSFTTSQRGVSVGSNGVVLFGTNADQAHYFTKGGSNFVVWHTDRTEVYQPWYFTLDAESVSAYGLEKLTNPGFEVPDAGTLASNWWPSITFAGIGLSTNVHDGTHAFVITNGNTYVLTVDGNDWITAGTDSPGKREEWTFEFWIYVDGLPAQDGYVVVRENGTNNVLGVYVTTTGVVAYHQRTASSTIKLNGPSIPLNQWVHVAVVKYPTQSSVAFFFNGQVAGTNYTATWDPIYTGNPYAWRIGSSTNMTNSLKAKIADVRLWHTNRTAAEILANYKTRLTGSEAWLLHYWRLDEGSGTTVDDEVSGMADGTFAFAPNAPAWELQENTVSSEVVSITETNLAVSFWTYGDGSGYARYGVYDPVLGTWLLSVRPVASAAAGWYRTETIVPAAAGETKAQLVLYGPTAGYAYFDDASVKYATTETNLWSLAAYCLARIGEDLYWSGKRLLQAHHANISVTNWFITDGGMTNVTITGATIMNSTYGMTGTNQGIVHYDGTNLQASLTPIWYVTNSPYKWISHTLYASNIVATNFVQAPTVQATNIYGATASLSSSLTVSNVFGTNLVSSNITAATAYLTNVTSTTVGATTVNVTTVNASDVNTSSLDASSRAQAPTGTFTNIHATTASATTVYTTTLNGTNGTFSGDLSVSRLYPLLSSNAPGASYELSYINGAGVAITSNLWWGLPHRWTNENIGLGVYAGYGLTNSNNVLIGRNAGIGSNSYALFRTAALDTNVLATNYGVTFGQNFTNLGAFECWVLFTNDFRYTVDDPHMNDGFVSFAEIKGDGWREFLRFGFGKNGTLYGPYMSYNDLGDVQWCIGTNIMPGWTAENYTWHHFSFKWSLITGTLQIDMNVDGVSSASAFYTTGVFTNAFRGWNTPTNGSVIIAEDSDVLAIRGVRVWSTNIWPDVLFTNRYEHLTKDSVLEQEIWNGYEYVTVDVIPFLDHSYPILSFTNEAGVGPWVKDEGNIRNDLLAASGTNYAAIVSDMEANRYLNPPTPAGGIYGKYQPKSSGFLGDYSHAATSNLSNTWVIGTDGEAQYDNMLALGSTNMPMNLQISGLTPGLMLFADSNRVVRTTNVTFGSTNVYNITNELNITNEYYTTNVYNLTNEYALTNQYYLTNLYSLTNEYALTNLYNLTNEYSITNQYALTNEYFSTNIYNLTNSYALTNQYLTTNVYNITNESGISGSGTENTIPIWITDTQLGNSPLTYAADNYVTNSAHLLIRNSLSGNKLWIKNTDDLDYFKVSSDAVTIGQSTTLHFASGTNNVVPTLRGYIQIKVADSLGFYLPVYSE
jgi:hypothetical protein